MTRSGEFRSEGIDLSRVLQRIHESDGPSLLRLLPVEKPIDRDVMSPEKLDDLQKLADDDMGVHWSVVVGVLTFEGKGKNI